MVIFAKYINWKRVNEYIVEKSKIKHNGLKAQLKDTYKIPFIKNSRSKL